MDFDHKYNVNRITKITNEILEQSIRFNWEKYIKTNEYSATETTYMLFDNLFRLIRKDPEQMKLTYETLISLNEKEGNKTMVSRLKFKQSEYFQGVDEKTYSLESSSNKER